MSADRLHSAVTIKADPALEKCRTLEEEVRGLKSQVQELTSRRGTEGLTVDSPSDATKEDEEALLAENHSLSAEIEELRTHVAELEGEVSEFDEENTALQQENEHLRTKIQKFAITNQKLEQLQNLIKELNDNWVTALGREKTLANQLFSMKEERDLYHERCSMVVEDFATWHAKTANLSKMQVEFYTLQEEVQEIPRLKSECKKLIAENMKMQRFSRQKNIESEKLQEDLFVLSRKVEYMREMSSRSGQNVEAGAADRANFDLMKQKYDKVKGKYREMRDQLALCNSRIRCFETSLEKVTQQQAVLTQRLKAMPENASELEETSVAIGSLMERLQSKSFFSAAVAEELQVISREEEETRSKVELDKAMVEAKASELVVELHALKNSLAAAQSRIDTLEKVEKLVQRHFPRAQDIVLILSQVLTNREEELRVKVQSVSKPISPQTGPAGMREQLTRRSTISLNSSGSNFAVGGVKAQALASSLKDLEQKSEPKKKTFGGMFKLG